MANDQYARKLFDPEYDKIPKSVFAAIAWHLADKLADKEEHYVADEIFDEEWSTLYCTDLIKQKPLS